MSVNKKHGDNDSAYDFLTDIGWMKEAAREAADSTLFEIACAAYKKNNWDLAEKFFAASAENGNGTAKRNLGVIKHNRGVRERGFERDRLASDYLDLKMAVLRELHKDTWDA